MSEVVLSAVKRVDTGKAIAGRLRRAGRIPGVMYGAKIDPDAISFEKLELGRLLRRNHSIINVKIDGEDQRAVIKEIQNHPVTGEVSHVDFMRVVAGQEITVTVPVRYTGKAIGTTEGGVLTTLITEMQISVLPRHMPESIDIDISALKIGDAIRLQDLELENITPAFDRNELFVQVVLPREEEEEEVVDELGESDEMEEPEVITARGDDDDDAEESKKD